jgi:hypothetical protein
MGVADDKAAFFFFFISDPPRLARGLHPSSHLGLEYLTGFSQLVRLVKFSIILYKLYSRALFFNIVNKIGLTQVDWMHLDILNQSSNLAKV